MYYFLRAVMNAPNTANTNALKPASHPPPDEPGPLEGMSGLVGVLPPELVTVRVTVTVAVLLDVRPESVAVMTMV